MTQAIGAYREVVQSPEFRELERLRAEARSNEASALNNAERKKAFEIARNALQKKMSIGDIVDITGLTREEVESLTVAN